MNKHAADTMTTAALRHLDPAPTTALTDAERERADATFARILATPATTQSRRSPIARGGVGVTARGCWVWPAPPVPPSPHCCSSGGSASGRGRRSPSHLRPRPQ